MNTNKNKFLIQNELFFIQKKKTIFYKIAINIKVIICFIRL